jgi:hypothetical protein
MSPNQNKQDLLKRISELESLNDQMMTELRYLDKLLKNVGFEEGLQTLKQVAEEMIDEDKR